MDVVVNGGVVTVPDGAGVAQVLTALGVDPTGGGLAVAVDGSVLPAGRWSATRFTGGERVEVLGAVAGG